MIDRFAIGVDLGGTNLKVGLVDSGGALLDCDKSPLPPDPQPVPVIDEMVSMVDALLGRRGALRSDLVGVGVGAPGPLSPGSGEIIGSVNLPAWRHVPIRDLLQNRLGRPVVLDNDGNTAAYGEYWAGSGKGGGAPTAPQQRRHLPHSRGVGDSDDLVMLTLGTGVGAGVVINGSVLHGAYENGAELGHCIVLPDGEPCPCGQRGCLEQYASAANVARRVRQAIKSGEACILACPSPTDSADRQAATAVDARRIAQAAQSGDPLCRRIWNEACFYLAIACVNIQHTFNPVRVVLGGGMSEAGDFLLEPVRRYFTEQTWQADTDAPEIALAALGYNAGLIGAAGLAWLRRAD